MPTSRRVLITRSPHQASALAEALRSSGLETILIPTIELAEPTTFATLDAARDPIAQWILAPHSEAASEVSWSGVIDGALTSVRVDRVFSAGLDPQSEGQDAWWIVDYKTAHADGLDPAIALPQLRAVFAPQLEAYAEVLRKLRGSAQIHAGLYYPRMSLFDWWQI